MKQIKRASGNHICKDGNFSSAPHWSKGKKQITDGREESIYFLHSSGLYALCSVYNSMFTSVSTWIFWNLLLSGACLAETWGRKRCDIKRLWGNSVTSSQVCIHLACWSDFVRFPWLVFLCFRISRRRFRDTVDVQDIPLPGNQLTWILTRITHELLNLVGHDREPTGRGFFPGSTDKVRSLFSQGKGSKAAAFILGKGAGQCSWHSTFDLQWRQTTTTVVRRIHLLCVLEFNDLGKHLVARHKNT